MTHKEGFFELFFLFFTGSILGFILEGVWRLIRTGVWENHSSTVYGPFCLIYGLASVIMYLLTEYISDYPGWVQFFVFACIGALTEYLGSLFQEIFFGSVSWDYSGRLFNLNGRICLSMTILWGMLGLFFSQFVVPVINNFFYRTADHQLKGLYLILSVLMAGNMIITAAALLRWHERNCDVPPRNIIDESLDLRFNDEKMEKIFNNLVFVEKDH